MAAGAGLYEWDEPRLPAPPFRVPPATRGVKPQETGGLPRDSLPKPDGFAGMRKSGGESPKVVRDAFRSRVIGNASEGDCWALGAF
jgi:hypothetical protein